LEELLKRVAEIDMDEIRKTLAAPNAAVEAKATGRSATR
jgi:hypothetical protein